MSKTHITKPWITTIFVLILLLAFIITWVLVGEFNVLHQQWLIAYRGVLWSGKITDKNIDWLKNTFSKYMNDPSQLKVGDTGKILSNQLIFNPLILIPLLSCLVLGVIVPIIFKPFHIMNLDVLPYSITGSISMFILIITGLIPHWDNGDIWLWIIRFVILLICLFVIFLLTNRLINKILIQTNYASAVINEFNQVEQEKKQYRQSLKDLTKQVEQKDKMKYVEE